jgi:sigma-B regulation protein RsbU (phosphoserine phosphatase)
VLYEEAPCGLLLATASGSIRRVNRTLCRWLGYAPEELIGRKRLQDLLSVGSKIFHQTHWLPLLEIQGSVAEVQLEFMHRGQHKLPVLVNALRRTEGGEVWHEIAVFIATDRRKYERELLAARRSAEELLERERQAQDALQLARSRLRLALDSAHLLVWDVDLVTGLPTYDPGVRSLLQLPEEIALTAEAYRARIHPDDREAEREAFLGALLASHDGTYAAEYRLLGHQGAERVVSSSGRAFYDQEGRLAGFSGVLQDVTSWRRAEARLREQEQEARSHALVAEQLVGIVSHDLRTPLQAIVLGASMLASVELSPAHTRIVARIASATNRARRLTADLLDFTQARLGSGLRMTRGEIDLHTLVADGIEELKLAWPGRMIEHRQEGVGPGWADPDRLAQVVTNLGNNALTYGAPDRPILVTSIVGEGQLSIQIHNHGPAIPPALLPHLFEPMRRGEQQVKLGSRSVGLGLYIVQQIALAHGGRVAVQSAENEGTIFTLTLPSRASLP